MDTLIFSAAFASIAASVFLLSRPFDKRILALPAMLCALCIGADDLLTGLGSTLRGLDFPGGQWNWTGKLLSLGFSAVVIAVLGLSPPAIGLTLKQRHSRIGLAALAFFIVWGACLGLLFRPGAADAETLAFQATMPGLSEELVYRGIAPALLLGLTRHKDPVDDMPWAVIIATAVVFGVSHGLRYSAGHFGFDFMSALFPLVGSIPGGWLRFKTGSLLFPVLAHNLGNVAFHVAARSGA